MGQYIRLDVPVSFNVKEFNPINAYFLGAILSANEPRSDNGKVIWLAPYRHNFGGYANEINIQEHIDIIKTLIKRADGKILSRSLLVQKNWFPANKQGFGVAFESPAGTKIDDIISSLSPIIDIADESVVRCFVVGAFDGRSSVDHDKKENKIRYLSLDCNNAGVANLLNKSLARLGFGENNYNTSRDRVEGGAPRKNQFRISSEDALLFIEKIGMICPSRFGQFKDIFPDLYECHNYDLLNGLKTLSEIQTSVGSIDNQSTYHETSELQADQILLEEIDRQISENLESESVFEYTGQPQIKTEPVFINGHKSYKRDKKKALNALTKAKYRCEISVDHPTFIRRNSNQNYTEPHHLIPLSFSDDFSVSLDVEENIVSLCSNCHNQLHYGRDIRPLLEKLYNDRKDVLKKAGIDITLEDLIRMYDA